MNSLKSKALYSRLVNLTRRRLALRPISTSEKQSGGGSAAHSHDQHQTLSQVTPVPKQSPWQFTIPDDPRTERGYLYREGGNLQGGSNATIGKTAVTLLWFWIFYNLWATPETFLGHMAYPQPSKWTNEELGIPPDDE
jgi:hypothetical protein